MIAALDVVPQTWTPVRVPGGVLPDSTRAEAREWVERRRTPRAATQAICDAE